MDELVEHLQKLVNEHEHWRSQTINLIASENALSPMVRSALDSDLVQRYGDFTGRDLSARRYRGNRYIEQIERETAQIAQSVFRAKYVELRPISGHVAGAAVLMGLCQPGDRVLEPGRDGGGHREGGKFSSSALVPLEIQYLPFDAARYNIDIDAAVKQIRESRPRVVILGSSNFLFPHPVAVIAEILHKELPDSRLVFDGSHVMGFLAAGRFQDPLAEGADLVFGSTHKTFPGPQGGIIFSNSDDLMDSVCEATYPALVTNHHLFRLPAMGLALLELQRWGGAYMDATVANAQALGEALQIQGVPCVCVDGSYSQSHTLLACVQKFGTGAKIAERLEAAGIITTAAHLPEYWGVEGIRLGVQELTRHGATLQDMNEVARYIAAVVTGTQPSEQVALQTAVFASGLGPVQFTWMD